MEKHILLKNSIFFAQTCSEGTYDEALEWIRKENPAGTTNNWMKSYEDGHLPIACGDYKGRTHYIFVC